MGASSAPSRGIEREVENAGVGQILRANERRVGDDLGIEARGVARVDHRVRQRRPVEHQILAQELRAFLARGAFARIIVEQMEEALGRRPPARVDPAGPEQHEAIDPVRRLDRQAQRRRAAERIAEEMRLADAQRVEEAEH